MVYKVIALRDVTIRAMVKGTRIVNSGGKMMMIPSETEEWIFLRAGQERDALVTVVGVHPKDREDLFATFVRGEPIVLADTWEPTDLPKVFFGLYRLECCDPRPVPIEP